MVAAAAALAATPCFQTALRLAAVGVVVAVAWMVDISFSVCVGWCRRERLLPSPRTADEGYDRSRRRISAPGIMGAVPLDIPGLTTEPALSRPDLLAPPVTAALEAWAHREQVAVTEIDPALADTAALVEAYDLDLGSSVNCVLVAGARGGEERVAACLVAADTRADVNRTVRRLLDVRKCSFLPMDRAVTESGMEYGGITPVGLPETWRVLVDARVSGIEAAIIGSGVRHSKLVVPGALLAELPGAEVVEDLAVPVG